MFIECAFAFLHHICSFVFYSLYFYIIFVPLFLFLFFLREGNILSFKNPICECALTAQIGHLLPFSCLCLGYCDLCSNITTTYLINTGNWLLLNIFSITFIFSVCHTTPLPVLSLNSILLVCHLWRNSEQYRSVCHPP